MLAPIATTYEQAMTEGEGKNTWRTDRYSPCPRREAGRYLAFLASIGYQLADIEQSAEACPNRRARRRAVVDGVHFAGNVPSTDSLPGVANNEPGSCGGDPGLGDEPSPAPDITDGVGRHPRDSTTGVVSVGAETAAA